MEEAYILRDNLTHNDLWEYTMRDDGTPQILHRLFGGNKNFKRNVDFKATPIRTKILGLPVVRGKPDHRCLKVVYATLAGALQFANKSTPNETPVDRDGVRRWRQ